MLHFLCHLGKLHYILLYLQPDTERVIGYRDIHGIQRYSWDRDSHGKKRYSRGSEIFLGYRESHGIPRYSWDTEIVMGYRYSRDTNVRTLYSVHCTDTGVESYGKTGVE